MNILHINNYHYFRGGAETVYFETAKLLESYGHRSVFFSMQHPKNLPCETDEYFMPYIDLNAKYGIVDKFKIAGRILYSFEARERLSKLLDKCPVDIAHLQNIYHSISPSILHELKKRNIPVVMTIEDPKLVCGSHNLYINEKPCTACSGGKHFMAIMKRCVKDSYAKSALVALEMYLHHNILHIYDNVDVFIFTSLFFKNLFKEMGFKSKKEAVHLLSFIDIQKWREFSPDVDDRISENGNYIIYVGGLLQDKGLQTLLEAAKLLSYEKKKIEIRMAGDGPIREQLHEKVRTEDINNVRFLGYINKHIKHEYERLCQEIKNSLAVVLPSENYENNPLSIIEAFALGKPVIGSRLGGIPELVKDNERGLTFEPKNPEDLSSRIRYLRDNPDEAQEWGRNARMFVEQELNAEKYYQRLMEVYRQAIEKRL